MKPPFSFEPAPFYCEENVWMLLAEPFFAARPSWALIMSNQARRMAMRRQLAGEGGYALWDYHVALFAKGDGEKGEARIEAWDFASSLPFPCPAVEYLESSFSAIPPDLAPGFRVIEGPLYRSALVSDRSHMRNPDGSWLAPPPAWDPPGKGSGREANLMEWIDVRRPGPGFVMNLREVLHFFSV